MGLYSKFKDNISKLTYQVILDELENLKYTGESRIDSLLYMIKKEVRIL